MEISLKMVEVGWRLCHTFPCVVQVLEMLQKMDLAKYIPIFREEHVTGDILSTCDDALLKEELEITMRLHRMRLLRVIEGKHSVQKILSGQDGYVAIAIDS